MKRYYNKQEREILRFSKDNTWKLMESNVIVIRYMLVRLKNPDSEQVFFVHHSTTLLKIGIGEVITI